MEEACTFIVSNFLRCKGRNNIVKCKNILLLNKTVRKVFFGGRLQNARTQHTAKAIDYQGMELSEKFFVWVFIIGVCNEYLQWAFAKRPYIVYPKSD